MPLTTVVAKFEIFLLDFHHAIATFTLHLF